MSSGSSTAATAPPTSASEVADAVALLRDVCARLEPAAVDEADVAVVFDALVAGQRLMDGAVTRFAARYAQVGGWRRSGAKSVEDDIGTRTGTSTTHARRQLAASKRLSVQRSTDDALRNGVVSGDQAVEVSDAASVAPGAEAELLRSARDEPMHQLRKRAAAAKAAADTDREATRRRLHGLRSVRRWNDADGMGNLLLKLPADEMVEIDASLKASVDAIFADARRTGRAEPPEAYTADAVAARLLGKEQPAGRSSGGARTCGSQAVRPDKKVIAVIDVEALNRGTVEGDERCEIAGIGPVSVSAVRQHLSEAVLALVITDGVDVGNVTHLGRQVTAHQRTALESRGGACEFCGSTFNVEIDHVTGWALTHTTHVDDLTLKCRHCHERKTRLGLKETGPPGNRQFLNPDETPVEPPRADTPSEDPAPTTEHPAKHANPLQLLD